MENDSSSFLEEICSAVSCSSQTPLTLLDLNVLMPPKPSSATNSSWGGVDAKNTESDKSLPGSMDTAVGFRAATLVSFNKT